MKLPAIGLIAGLLLSAGCDVKVGQGGLSFDIASGKATEEWTRSYTVQPGASLEIENFIGQIEASPADGPRLEVLAVREARANSDEAAKELLSKTEMVEEVEQGTRQQVKSVRISLRGVENRGRSFGRNGVSVRYTIRVPAGLNASFKTENGGVRLEGIDGTFTATTTNGGVTTRDLKGSLKASAVNGGLQIDLASVTGDVDLSVVNGGIRLELPSDVNGLLDASAVNGGVSIDDALRLTATDQDRRHVSGTLNRGGPKIVAHTTNGGVRVHAGGPGDRSGQRERGPDLRGQ